MKKSIAFKIGNIHQEEGTTRSFWVTTQMTLYTVG